jgi:battenin
VVGYYSSGTGFAGIFGASIILMLKVAGFNDGTIFFIIAPSVVLYFLSFYWLHRVKVLRPYIAHESTRSPEPDTRDYNTNEDTHHLINPSPSDREVHVIDEAKDNQALGSTTVKKINRYVGYHMLNLALVYFLEYLCTTCFADRIAN